MKHTQIENILKDIGFTELEAKIYLFILYNEVVTASKIYKLLELDKSSVYRTLDNLQNNKFIDSTKNKYGQQYFVLDPNLLVEKAEGIYKHQQGIFQKVSQFVEDIQDDPSVYMQQKNIQIYSGEEAYLKFREKQLSVMPNEILEISPVKILNMNLQKYYDYEETFHDRRESQNIILKRLIDYPIKKSEINDPGNYSNLFYKNLLKKITPKLLISIFGDFIAFIKYEGSDIVGIIQYDPMLSMTMADIYYHLWEYSDN